MTDSVLPAFSQWWRSSGVRDGDGALIRVGSSSTPYDQYAAPRASGKWTIEYEYSADAEAVVWIVINRFSAANVKLGEAAIFDRRLPAAQNSKIVLDFDLPATVTDKWLPSIRVREGADVKFHWLKTYETPAPSPTGPAATVWTGTEEAAATVTVWDGTREIPASLEIQA